MNKRLLEKILPVNELSKLESIYPEISAILDSSFGDENIKENYEYLFVNSDYAENENLTLRDIINNIEDSDNLQLHTSKISVFSKDGSNYPLGWICYEEPIYDTSIVSNINMFVFNIQSLKNREFFSDLQDVFNTLYRTHREVHWFANDSDKFTFRKRYDKLISSYNGTIEHTADGYHYCVINEDYDNK